MTAATADTKNAKARKAVRAIPGANGWWHSNGRQTYERLLDQLVAHGFNPDDAVELLEAAYGAAAGEFGT